MTTNLGVNLVDRFNPNKDNKSDFNDNIDGDKDVNNENM